MINTINTIKAEVERLENSNYMLDSNRFRQIEVKVKTSLTLVNGMINVLKENKNEFCNEFIKCGCTACKLYRNLTDFKSWLEEREQ